MALLQFTSVEALPLGLSGLEFAVLHCLLVTDRLLFVKAACLSNCWRILQSATAKVLTCFWVMNPFERWSIFWVCSFFVFFFVFLSFYFPLPPPYHFLLKQRTSSLAWKGWSLWEFRGRANGGCAHCLNKCWSSLKFKLSVMLICCPLGAPIIKFKTHFYVN